jgi:hypothetical protein
MDGQTKRASEILNQYLRTFVSADQRIWADYMDLAEFSFKAATYSVTKQLLFKMTYEVNSLQHVDQVLERANSTLEFN